MRSEVILAIDQGTTGTTVLAFDRAGRLRSRGYAELPQHFPRPGWVEHHGEEIWGTTLRALRAAVTPLGGARARVAAIGLTNQRETTLVWDRTSSKPAAPGIVWQDRRTAERCAALKRAGKETWVTRRTGLKLDPYFSGTKLEWLLRNVGGLKARARRGGLAFGTVDSWLLWMLTGGRVHATDATNASRTLLYDIRRHRWDPDLLDLFGVPDSVLPEVRPSCADFGVTRGVPGLADGVPVLGIAGDQQAALFGQGCVEAGGLKNTYGTGCFLLLHTGEKLVPSRSGLLTTVACGPRGEPRYALEGSVFIAGAAIQWLRDGLGILKSAAESEALARQVPDAGGTILVPAFAGLGAPYWRPEARGIWCGLTRGTTRAHLVRAALESIAFQSRDLVEAMERESGVRVRALRVDGGASLNAFLMQFQADLLGIRIARPGLVETTALGAALLAGIGAGWWKRAADLGAARRNGREFRPRMRRAERDRLYRGWKEAVELLLDADPA
ncbi:MAG: glycerol kinase GlpK [Candidatus Eisenbacteria bacterium]|uniref:Glycerol kinase n=1 Tax=Eiseniibacteriota bacterium TaxID=2212470 RepID=A0A538TIQ7_UNCEI|nr:MAG: glycerol kinase GlpK [Candidatus Eisenbacteria bacterium]TMQ63502.1 MAG: glycerol kinase GlpK [Candidatus Eisenbacteria bacterium]